MLYVGRFRRNARLLKGHRKYKIPHHRVGALAGFCIRVMATNYTLYPSSATPKSLQPEITRLTEALCSPFSSEKLIPPVGGINHPPENPEQLSLAIEDAPSKVRAWGLREAHSRPLVGVRDDGGAGRIVRTFRTAQAQAWGFPDVGYPRSASAYCALVVDVDDPGKLQNVLAEGDSLLPNWCVFNRKTGHAHVCYPLAAPVLEHPESKIAPLLYLADIEKKLLAALDGDPAYAGALARNPLTKPAWQTQVLWFRQHPWELSELDEAAESALPEGWTPATAAPGGVGRNCSLFEGLMTWAGRPAHRFESILVQAHSINSEFATPLPGPEVRHTVKSVAKYRRRWEANGWHSPRWIQKQAARGRASGKARRDRNAGRDIEIVDSYDGGMTQTAIARKWGLSQARVSQLLNGQIANLNRI